MEMEIRNHLTAREHIRRLRRKYFTYEYIPVREAMVLTVSGLAAGLLIGFALIVARW